MAKITGAEILDLPMQRNDANAKTIREYLKALLRLVIEHQEDFNGKRPFGNSGWIGELHVALLQAGAITGRLDRQGYIEDYDDRTAYKLIMEAIEAL